MKPTYSCLYYKRTTQPTNFHPIELALKIGPHKFMWYHSVWSYFLEIILIANFEKNRVKTQDFFIEIKMLPFNSIYISVIVLSLSISWELQVN